MLTILFLALLSPYPSLPYTEAALLEAQRLADITPLAVAHKAVQDTKLQGYFIPKVRLSNKIRIEQQLLSKTSVYHVPIDIGKCGDDEYELDPLRRNLLERSWSVSSRETLEPRWPESDQNGSRLTV